MPDIFISYAREDQSRIEPLAKSLGKLGWSVFWDRTIPAGKTWRQVIGDALKNARSVIVVWSETSIKSRWVQEESDWGLERNILIPILIDEIRPPLGFAAVQAVDLVKWDPAQSSPEFERLISGISIILGTSPKHVKEKEQAMEEERKRKSEEERKRMGSRSPYKVFVSSTFLDNQERRKLVQDAITMADMVWHGINYAAADRKPHHSSSGSRTRRYVWRIKMQVAGRFAASLSCTGFS